MDLGKLYRAVLKSQIPKGCSYSTGHAYPDSKVHGAKMGPIWGRQDPGGPHVVPMNFAIWVSSLQMLAFVPHSRMYMHDGHELCANDVYECEHDVCECRHDKILSTLTCDANVHICEHDARTMQKDAHIQMRA